jgi:Spy/CpxP family protein refolding chaperone
MKKTAICIAFLSISLLSMAQIKRTPNIKTDSSGLVVNPDAKRGEGQMQMLKELNLTREQRGKLKEMRQANKAKKEEIDNDTKLSDTERQQKLKQLRQEQMQGMMSILTDEQKQKFKEMRKNKDGKAGEEVQLNNN